MNVLVGEIAGPDGSWAAVGTDQGGVWIRGDLTLSPECQEEFAQVYARACWLGEQDSVMDQPTATGPATSADAEHQPCERCHALVPPLRADDIIPYYLCPSAQTTECLERAAELLRAEKDADPKSPEET